MERNKLKKLVISTMLILLVSIIFCNVYADINEDYYNKNLGAFKVSDNKEQLNEKTLASVLLEALGILIYALASLGEWLLGMIFQAASGGSAENNIFPWADAILFNAIPLLDINFINPYVGGGTIVELIKDVISSIYGTVFGLAISFFSIVVLIMGIKLAISTIASEKAKYKQAVMDWIVGLVLLFTMHFFISFVFYLNERLVMVAEDIASKQLESNKAQDLINIDMSNVSMQDLLKNFVSAQYGITGWSGAIPALINLLNTIDGTAEAKLNNLLEEKNIGVAYKILTNEKMCKYGINSDFANPSSSLEWADLWTTADPLRVDFVVSSCTIFNTYIADGTSVEEFNEICDKQIEQLTSGSPTYKNFAGDNLEILDPWGTDMARLACTGPLGVHAGGLGIAVDSSAIGLVEGFKEVYGELKTGNSKYSLIANLAQYFKETAWTRSGKAWKANKVSIQNALLYAIIVVQSFIFLIAYIKRLFYVIILAIMAPLVVVYDFFNKMMT